MKLHSSSNCIALRVEWAKAKARAERWEEEVVLINEEMRRVLVFCRWKATWWKEQVGFRTTTVLIDAGLRAYSERQAAMEDNIAALFSRKWEAVRVQAWPVIEKLWGRVGGSMVEPDDDLDLDIGGSSIVELDFGALGIGDAEDEAAYGSDYEE